MRREKTRDQAELEQREAVRAAAEVVTASIRAEPRTRLLHAQGHDGGVPVPALTALGANQSVTTGGRGTNTGAGGADAEGAGRLGRTDLGAVAEFVEIARRLVFPGFFDDGPLTDTGLPDHVTALTARLAAHLADQITGVIRYAAAGRHAADLASRGRSTGGETQRRGKGEWEGKEEWGGNEKWGDRQGSARPAVDLRPGESIETDGPVIAWRAAHRFLERLTEVRRLLALDVRAAYDGDPAAEHTDEVILCYPGIDAVFAHRVAHELYLLGVPVLPRIISEQAHARTGIDIHPGARIGESFFIDHGSGTVIGETTVIGRGVKVYQGVTLGARSFQKDEEGKLVRGVKRHPTIGDRVTIYAGAVILGGDTVIGDDCVVAGGVFVTSSVPAGHVVHQPRAEVVVRAKAGSGGAGGVGGMWGEGI